MSLLFPFPSKVSSEKFFQSSQGVDPKNIENDVAYGEIMGTPLGSMQTVLFDLFKVSCFFKLQGLGTHSSN